ncbi:MAG TPA: cytochrome ubiquinol oxidase subunit I [Phycisphaerae bacterium]|jgi:cytochrome d ubiquinol oxidase subunit I|nr:cytochrome ubiquinol oxidase subunit I [Phycisphaerae bacterium]HOB74770.1 cytochrome ubiquinol oxidase subunit I [Phycisphaerae bacterium]HOJ55226.1 cytochrome ubiquinol oxidase subunit I [Phycisphaerae bacterium]HOL27752.1 cytochrome ubiquinol oxidase subunit I [Phycisphaerae bacterium]HPP22678.1 cytochrome ubiquinol oxidase subunit I [Phycisphaerae bacterium]
MDLDVVLLSRLQFALTIMFHYLFPPLTIGMGVVLVYLEGMYLWRREPIYETAARFWTQLFAVTFAVGVASGIVMEFQFGTNWAAYSRFVGDVFGSALAAEGIFAFFLESGFLAVLVFGWDKVSAGFHFFATLMVALGSIFSAIWIVVANSWQQTPAGHHIVQMMRDGRPWLDAAGEAILRAETVDFWSVVLNPSTIDRLTHTLIGAFIMGAFFIMSISAYYLLKGRHEEFARRSFTGALIFGTVFSLAQLVSGHSNANMVADHQPIKLAAFEGHFRTGPADLSILGWPDEDARVTRFNVAIPGLLSFLVHNDASVPVIGLDKVPRAYWPPVAMSFVSYHVMVGIGTIFIALTVLASVLRWRGTLFQKRWLMWTFVFAVILAVAANQLGWIAAEVGRQPWSVHPRVERDAAGGFVFDADGMLKYRLEEGLLTSKAVSEAVSSGQVVGSIVMFGLVYLLLGAIWVLVLNHKIHHGPVPVTPLPRTTGRGIIESAAGRVDHEASMTEAKDPEDRE